MKRIICNISNTCLQKEVKIETEKYKNPEDPIKQIASQFMLRQDQFSVDKNLKIKEIQKCKHKYTLTLTILKPVQNITFIFYNFKILLYNCFNKNYQDIINQFNKQKIYFSPNCLSNLKFKLWDIILPPTDFKFNCIPSETNIFVEPLNTVILNYNGFTFICSEDDTVSEIKPFILSIFKFSNEVFIKILPNKVDVPENGKLCGRNRYVVELYCLFNFYQSNKALYMKQLDYFTTVFQFKNYYNQIYNESDQIRPENIIVHHPSQGGYEIDRCYLIDILSYNQHMKKYMIYYHILEQKKHQVYGNAINNQPEQLENNQEMKNQSKIEENQQHQKTKSNEQNPENQQHQKTKSNEQNPENQQHQKIKSKKDIKSDHESQPHQETKSTKQDQIDHENHQSLIASSETKPTKHEDQPHSPQSQQVQELSNGEVPNQNLKPNSNPHKISKHISKSRFQPQIIRKEDDNDEPQQTPKPHPNQEKRKESEESAKYSFKYKNTTKLIKLKNDSILIENEPKIKELFQIESNESLQYSIANDDDDENDDKSSESIDANKCILKSLINKLIEISFENKIESQNGQTKVMKKYLYQTNDDANIHEIELDSQAKIIDMKTSIAKLKNVKNISNIKILFAGKDLLNDIVLNSLEIESSVLFVYIRSQEDILLMTAKALRFSDSNPSEESGYSDE